MNYNGGCFTVGEEVTTSSVMISHTYLTIRMRSMISLEDVVMCGGLAKKTLKLKIQSRLATISASRLNSI